MTITKIEIWKFSIPMHPFTIATGTMNNAENLFIRVHTSENIYGVGECSALPMITGESQATCFEMAKVFANIWKNKDASKLDERMKELHDHAAFNGTVKSAFDMALFDLASKAADQPLYEFLGGEKKQLSTDITVGIDSAADMAGKAKQFASQGAQIIKVKLGKDAIEDVKRIKEIRESIGEGILIRIDANQGWNLDNAMYALQAMAQYNIEFCEQPLRKYDDEKLPRLRKLSPIKIMADESVFDHHDALRLLRAEACDYVNIKMSKAGGMLEAIRINEVCEQQHIPCMMGGMLESRIGLTAFAHFAAAHSNIMFYDLDTCLLGHKVDPVKGGVTFNGFVIDIPETAGIGADADDAFLETLTREVI